LKLLEFQT